MPFATVAHLSYDEGVRSLAISVAGYEAEAKGAAVCPQDLIAPLFAG